MVVFFVGNFMEVVARVIRDLQVGDTSCLSFVLAFTAWDHIGQHTNVSRDEGCYGTMIGFVVIPSVL